MLTVEPVASEHIPYITKIYNYYINETTVLFFNEEMTDADLAEETRCAAPFAHYAVKDEGRVIGHAAIKPHSARSAYAKTADVAIILDAKRCGMGVGETVMSFIERQARERGFHTLLALICGENEASLSFFHKHGFARNGLLKDVGFKFGRYLDVVYLQKILN